MPQTVYKIVVVDCNRQPEPYTFHLRIKDGADILWCAYQALQMHMNGECDRLGIDPLPDISSTYEDPTIIISANQVLSAYQRFVVIGVTAVGSVL